MIRKLIINIEQTDDLDSQDSHKLKKLLDSTSLNHSYQCSIAVVEPSCFRPQSVLFTPYYIDTPLGVNRNVDHNLSPLYIKTWLRLERKNLPRLLATKAELS